MSFIEQALGSYKEREAAAEGLYDLTIKDYKVKGSNILVILTIDGEPDLENVLHNLSLTTAEDQEDTANFKLGFQRAFLDMFGISYDDNGFDLSDFPGATASEAPLAQESYQGNVSAKLQLNI